MTTYGRFAGAKPHSNARLCLLFLQPRPTEPEYRMYHVKVVRRYRDVVLVQAPADSGSPLKAGAQVVTSGAVELRSVLDSVQPPPGQAKGN